jgi:bifunctional DNase/RNase
LDLIRLNIKGIFAGQSQISSYTLMLNEVDGTRRLPIVIGAFEAQAIALELEGFKPNRPMTHDLMHQFMVSYNIVLESVIISELKEGVFYSKLVLVSDGETKEIDARPSDAIALAVRFKADVFTLPEIMEEAGIETKEPEDSPENEPDETQLEEVLVHDTDSEMEESDELHHLREELNEAISNEDYEKAAQIRDRISKLESNN